MVSIAILNHDNVQSRASYRSAYDRVTWPEFSALYEAAAQS